MIARQRYRRCSEPSLLSDVTLMLLWTFSPAEASSNLRYNSLGCRPTRDLMVMLP